jgi:hypothetical protein
MHMETMGSFDGDAADEPNAEVKDDEENEDTFEKALEQEASMQAGGAAAALAPKRITPSMSRTMSIGSKIQLSMLGPTDSASNLSVLASMEEGSSSKDRCVDQGGADGGAGGGGNGEGGGDGASARTTITVLRTPSVSIEDELHSSFKEEFNQESIETLVPNGSANGPANGGGPRASWSAGGVQAAPKAEAPHRASWTPGA